ncbi:cytochrome ubiquinol oxidase subunit I [Sphingobacterium sp. SG20118]|uniref:cytochrome ubiquinol oxidase subunit I n=1 Tax=Sphingobacterium sp. SG20118 TaxID=3367156 RepID=UPI0037DFC208
MILYNRLQFAFTITFHYLFPQLTMGLSLMIVYYFLYFSTPKVKKISIQSVHNQITL